jgi:formylglycine-generating enzyme required for sulfatase activity
MQFVLVPKDKFIMGGRGGKLGNQEVTIPYDFYLGAYEVTQEQWATLMGANPSHFTHESWGRVKLVDVSTETLKQFPVEQVSWNDIQIFLAKLTEREPAPGWRYRLPSEAEWEYACRGGPLDDPNDYALDFYFDKPTNVLPIPMANFGGEIQKGLRRPCKVGNYPPNKLGLYDMHGNVMEWCQDEQPPREGGWPSAPSAAGLGGLTLPNVEQAPSWPTGSLAASTISVFGWRRCLRTGSDIEPREGMASLVESSAGV